MTPPSMHDALEIELAMILGAGPEKAVRRPGGAFFDEVERRSPGSLAGAGGVSNADWSDAAVRC